MNTIQQWLGCALFAITIFGISSCELTTSNKVQFSNLKFKKNNPLIKGQNEPSCNIDIKIAFATSPQAVADEINNQIIQQIFEYEDLAPQTALDSFTNNYQNRYRNDLTELYQTDRKNGIDSEWYNYMYQVEGKEVKGKETVVCYEVDMQVYEGGAHGIHNVFYLNFDPKTGSRITLKDLFKAEYKIKLNQLLIKKLMHNFECTTVDELAEKGVLLLTEMYPTENFKLDTNEIHFMYNPYAIAAYAVGSIQLSIPYSEIRDLLKKEDTK